MQIIALDFDGVIVDSIEECYRTSKSTYYGFSSFPHNKKLYKKYFYKFRGLVIPAKDYLVLHKMLEYCFVNEINFSEKIFIKIKNEIDENTLDRFESAFFQVRSYFQDKNFIDWVSLNPLTKFGKNLVNKENKNIYIVTTKNKKATHAILEYYDISYEKIYSVKDIKKFKSKGNLISNLIDKKKANSATFIDDSSEHLDSVTDKRINCYFADWGYGNNNEIRPYPILNDFNLP